MNTKRHRRLVNLNRMLILALSVCGLWLDGVQLADLPCILALFAWLWLPSLTRWERHLLHRAEGRRGAAGTARVSSSY